MEDSPVSKTFLKNVVVEVAIFLETASYVTGWRGEKVDPELPPHILSTWKEMLIAG